MMNCTKCGTKLNEYGICPVCRDIKRPGAGLQTVRKRSIGAIILCAISLALMLYQWRDRWIVFFYNDGTPNGNGTLELIIRTIMLVIGLVLLALFLGAARKKTIIPALCLSVVAVGAYVFYLVESMQTGKVISRSLLAEISRVKMMEYLYLIMVILGIVFLIPTLARIMKNKSVIGCCIISAALMTTGIVLYFWEYHKFFTMKIRYIIINTIESVEALPYLLLVLALCLYAAATQEKGAVI